MMSHSGHLSNNTLSTSPVNSSSIGSSIRRTPITNNSNYNLSDGLNISKSTSIVIPNSISGGIPIMNGGNSQSVLSNNVASSPPAVLSNSISANLTVNSSNMTPSPATNTSAILVTDYRQVITNQSGSQQVVQQSLPSYLPVDSMPVQSQQTQQMQVQQSQSQPNVNHVNMVQQNQSQMQVQTMSPQQLAASQAQAGYYMPPAIYVDQNGQPVYYRVAPQQQYQPELVYPDGSPADPMQVSYIQMPAPGYWPGAAMAPHDPNQQLSGQLYMSPLPQQQVDHNGLMRRLMPYPMPYPPTGLMPNNGPTMNNQPNMARQQILSPNGQQVIGGQGIYGVPAGHMPVPIAHQQVISMQQRSMINDNNLVDGYQVMMPNNMMQAIGQIPIRDDYGQHPNMHGSLVSSDYRSDNSRNYNSNHSGSGYGHNRGNSYDNQGNSREGSHRSDRGERADRHRSNHGGYNHYDRPHRKSSHSSHYTNSTSGNSSNTSVTNTTSDNHSNLSTAPRDPLVDEFRSTFGKSRQWSLRDLVGHVVSFCQDQHGSRFIQQRLEVCADNEKQIVFDEVLSAAHVLMTDVFGNYVLQKLFEFGASEQCDNLSTLLIGQCVSLSMQMYGCRVIQKALEYVSIPRLISLVKEFENPTILINCVFDANGNHVIQKCIEILSKASKDVSDNETREYLNGRMQFIIETFQGRVKELSSHPFGCRVVQRILEHCNNTQKATVLEELRVCCSELVQDCYGNYVIQFVMQHGWEADRAVLIKEVHANLLEFSQHKFASNVVEKCLQYASKRDRDEMIWKIINITFDTSNPIDGKGNSALEMVRDPYANYVVQKVIDVSDEKQRVAILRYVKENIVQLRRYTYGKHIILRLEKITNEKF